MVSPMQARRLFCSPEGWRHDRLVRACPRTPCSPAFCPSNAAGPFRCSRRSRAQEATDEHARSDRHPGAQRTSARTRRLAGEGHPRLDPPSHVREGQPSSQPPRPTPLGGRLDASPTVRFSIGQVVGARPSAEGPEGGGSRMGGPVATGGRVAGEPHLPLTWGAWRPHLLLTTVRQAFPGARPTGGAAPS